MSIHDQPNISLLIGVLENEFSRKAVVRETFVNFFNNRLETYHNNRFNYKNLQDRNKNILTDCFKFISNENKEIEKNTMVLKPPPSNHGFQSPSDNVKQQQLHNDGAFDSYKKQYDTMLNPKKPKEIDFSDTIEDQPIQNIDSIMNQTLEDRQKELERITNTYSEKPPDWIKPPENNQRPENQPMKLIIEDTPTKSTQSILKQKKVTFNLNTTNEHPIQTEKPKESIAVNKLLNKLKIKQSSNNLSNNHMQELIDKFELKIQEKMEAKFKLLNKKYDTLRIKYEELEMKYSELSSNNPEKSNLTKHEIEMLYT